MTMKNISIGVFFLFGVLQTQAQETKTLWQKDIPSSTQDFLTTMTSTIDRQILLSGSSINTKSQQSTTNNQNNGYDYHIIKLNQQGDKLWEKYFSGNRQDYLNATLATQEGGFLLAGTSYSTKAQDKKHKSLGSSDFWIIKVDENGEEQWQKTIGTKYADEARSVIQTVDLEYLVAGNTQLSEQGFGAGDVLIAKLDEKGKILYQTIFGGNGQDEIEKIIPTKDGGCLVAIYSQSGKYLGETKNKIASSSLLNLPANANSSSQNSNTEPEEKFDISFYGKQTENYGVGDYWVLKLDKTGKVEWENNFGGKEDDHIRTMAFTDSGYIIGGESRSESSGNKRVALKEGTDVWIVSLDHQGNEEWQKSYSLGNRDILMSLDVIRKTKKDNFSEDKGFLLGGYTQSEGKIQADDEKFWMLYIDVNGKEEWRKHVEGTSKKQEERLVSAKLQSDGTFLLAGTSAEELGRENWKILKLGDKDLDDLVENKEIRVYPNPAEDYCYVEIGFPMQFNEEAQIFLHDISGRQMQTIKTKNKVTKIKTAGLPQGVYVVTATTPNRSVNTKIVKK